MDKLKEAIILSGGEGWRLKPYEWMPKPLLKINEQTLIDLQISWLRTNGFKNIIVASNRDDLTSLPVEYSFEKTKLGTGGATNKAFKKIKGDVAYVMNVDDIVFYNPSELFEYAPNGAGVLLAKPRLPFGRVTLRNGTRVVRFEHRSYLDFYVSAGHHVFKKEIVQRFFPEKGDFEFSTMQRLADSGLLQGYTYHGMWLTINTMKDLIDARAYLKYEHGKYE
ncbi:MAG: NDP-sugar synthase [Candidatus Bathyarchaeota archaeon]|nr:NDP-sugar synthase [Candidatus Bathyarchaeota archaeon]MDH5779695.1 NDP-sugar synthase [Candidatus Bathyarchaeota archaeon]